MLKTSGILGKICENIRRWALANNGSLHRAASLLLIYTKWNSSVLQWETGAMICNSPLYSFFANIKILPFCTMDNGVDNGSVESSVQNITHSFTNSSTYLPPLFPTPYQLALIFTTVDSAHNSVHNDDHCRC